MEIIRRDELQELLDVVRVNPYGKFLITGTARSEETGTEYRDRYKIATGFEITAGAVEN